MRGGDWTWYWVQSMFRFWLKQGGMVRGASTWSCEKTRHTGMRARSGRTQQRAPSMYLVPVEHQTLGGVIPVLVVLKKLAAWCRRDTRAHKWVWRGTQTHNHLWVRGHLGTAQRAAWSLRIAGPCPPSLRTSRCGRTNSLMSPDVLTCFSCLTGIHSCRSSETVPLQIIPSSNKRSKLLSFRWFVFALYHSCSACFTFF